MRNRLFYGLLVGLLASGAAVAQPRTGTPAPVPAVPPPSNGLSATTPAPVPNAVPEQVAPADRIAGAGPGGQADASGPADSTPFSSSPSAMLPSDLRNGPQSREYPPSDSSDPPNLSK